MKRLIDGLETVTEWIMALMLAVMVGLVFGNVVLRYVFNSGIVAAEEIARLMFVWLVFLGATLALRRQQHLGLELVQVRLPPKARRACAVVSHLLMLYALWLFVEGSWIQLLIGTETYSTVLRFPMAFYAAAGFFPALAMGCVVLANLWRILSGEAGARIPGEEQPAGLVVAPVVATQPAAQPSVTQPSVTQPSASPKH